jgi:hypothetical protein
VGCCLPLDFYLCFVKANTEIWRRGSYVKAAKNRRKERYSQRSLHLSLDLKELQKERVTQNLNKPLAFSHSGLEAT